MAQKTALVVDDSLTARRILGRMLERHALVVDTAKSAEEALEYLARSRPDVVFLDHMMPGMDGMEALKAIKGDPNTAMVPVVMYTAKEGQLHVGQARALGAIGILSKQLRPGELFEVLHSLGMVPDKRTAARDGDESTPDERNTPAATEQPRIVEATALGDEAIEQIARATAAYVTNSSSHLHERRLLEERVTQLRHSVSQLRQEISELAREHGEERIALPGAVANEMQHRRLEEEREAKRNNLGRWRSPLALSLVLLLVVPAAVGLGFFLSERGDYFVSGERDRTMLETVGWALGDEGAFEFGEVVFDDVRLERLKGLVSRLPGLDFDGVVRLESYLGRPCLIGDRTDGYELPADDWPLDSCDYLGVSDEEAQEIGALSSEEFSAYVADHGAGESQGIRIEVVSRGHDEPLYAYPNEDAATTAEEWNRVAMRNNRVVVSLIPD